MSKMKFGWALVAVILSSCGGGTATQGNLGEQEFSSSSSQSVVVPIKTAAESFFDLYGVKAGLYEVVMEVDSHSFTTQGRILANEILVGSQFGFFPDIEFCDWGFLGGPLGGHFGVKNGFVAVNLQQRDPWGEISFLVTVDGYQEVIMAADSLNPDILRGQRFNERSGKSEKITMYYLSDSKNYDVGEVNLTTSFQGLEVIQSESVCYGEWKTPVFDDEGELAFYHDRYLINVVPQRGDLFSAENRNQRLLGIDIEESGRFWDGDEYQFSSTLYDSKGSLLVPGGSDDINIVIDEFGESFRADDTFRLEERSFRIEMEGAAGSSYEGLSVKGFVLLTSPPISSPISPPKPKPQ